MGFYYYFLDAHEWSSVSCTIISARCTPPLLGLQWGFIGDACCIDITGDVIKRSKGGAVTHGKHSACCPARGWECSRDVLLGSGWMFFKLYLVFISLSGKARFGGDSELSGRPEWVLWSRSWSKTVRVLCLEGISPSSGCVRICRCVDYSVPSLGQCEPSKWNQCLEEMAQAAQQLLTGEDICHWAQSHYIGP